MNKWDDIRPRLTPKQEKFVADVKAHLIYLDTLHWWLEGMPDDVV